MNLERLPSGKFTTNAFILELAIVAYNILRMIDQHAISERTPHQKCDIRRYWLYALIGNLYYDGQPYNYSCPPTDYGTWKEQCMATYICRYLTDICRCNQGDKHSSRNQSLISNAEFFKKPACYWQVDYNKTCTSRIQLLIMIETAYYLIWIIIQVMTLILYFNS